MRFDIDIDSFERFSRRRFGTALREPMPSR
jgi:hypothetical protein